MDFARGRGRAAHEEGVAGSDEDDEEEDEEEEEEEGEEEEGEEDTEEESEGVASLPSELKMSDYLMGKKILRAVNGVAYYGDVVHVGVIETTGELLYLIRYDDGDIEHLTAAQVREHQVDIGNNEHARRSSGAGS